MAAKPATQTVHLITYRYTDANTNTVKTSKLSMDIGIYQLLKANETVLFDGFTSEVNIRSKNSTIADKWIYVTAGELRTQNPNVSFASYMREYLYSLLIDQDFLEGYEINTEYVKIMCSKGEKSNTTIRLPSSLYYALTEMFDENADSIIKQSYAALRSQIKDDDTNFSYLLRHKLLEQVIDPDLKRIDAEATVQ
ncbi:hypothetical protein OTK49_00575 [Vibrio coralliirubri]|uniref:hypothetical protein n=1 Tax=Vibrio coralliirubri TaxID=1516159 RepID=UPI0022843869|nr:hypothetical protein [Vibrio coralliirubri]MCY9861036.1 hypothetical protein [Vibrio coralliirubri]